VKKNKIGMSDKWRRPGPFRLLTKLKKS